MAVEREDLKQKIDELVRERDQLKELLGQSRGENKQLKDRIASLEFQIRDLQSVVSRVRDLVKSPEKSEVVPGPERDPRFTIRFSATAPEAEISYGDPRNPDEIRKQRVKQARTYWLLRHVVLCAYDHISVSRSDDMKRIHYSWAAYLNESAPMESAATLNRSFTGAVRDVNSTVAEVLTGDALNRNAYLLEPEGKGAGGSHSYLVRLGSIRFDFRCITNIDVVDLYLRPRSQTDIPHVQAELRRCDRAIDLIYADGQPNAIFGADKWVGTTAAEIKSMKGKLGRVPTGDPWVDGVRDLVYRVKDLSETWKVDSSFDIQTSDDLVKLATELRDEYTPMISATKLIPQEALECLYEALFWASSCAQPDMWTTREQVGDYFRYALPLHLLNLELPNLDDADKELLNQRLIIYVADICLGDKLTTQRELVNVGRWLYQVTNERIRILLSADVRAVLQADWRNFRP